MEYFYNLLFYFAIYSFAGWCGEVVFATVRHGKFVNRGMLHGAYCPIYGFGLITVIVCLTPIKDSWLLLFAGSAVLTTVLEFITGFVLDKHSADAGGTTATRSSTSAVTSVRSSRLCGGLPACL